jgi:hypothetical protein
MAGRLFERASRHVNAWVSARRAHDEDHRTGPDRGVGQPDRGRACGRDRRPARRGVVDRAARETGGRGRRRGSPSPCCRPRRSSASRSIPRCAGSALPGYRTSQSSRDRRTARCGSCCSGSKTTLDRHRTRSRRCRSTRSSRSAAASPGSRAWVPTCCSLRGSGWRCGSRCPPERRPSERARPHVSCLWRRCEPVSSATATATA